MPELSRSLAGLAQGISPADTDQAQPGPAEGEALLRSRKRITIVGWAGPLVMNGLAVGSAPGENTG